jgi:hypothetical protein
MPYGNLEAVFDTKKLMQGDPNSIAEYTLKISQQGIATINELRNMHDLDPIEGGDEFAHANQGGDNNNEEESKEEDTKEETKEEPKKEDSSDEA